MGDVLSSFYYTVLYYRKMDIKHINNTYKDLYRCFSVESGLKNLMLFQIFTYDDSSGCQVYLQHYNVRYVLVRCTRY